MSNPVRLALALGFTFGLAAAMSTAKAAVPATVPYSWQNVAIKGGGLVSGLLFHPTERDLLYARTDVGGAFRWDPAGHRWIPLNDSLGRDDAELLGVVSFAVDPSDTQRLYLAGGSYLPDWGKPAAFFSSTDRGATWSRTPLPFHLGGNADGRQMGERLQVDPHDSAVLFLGTNQDGLWRSADRGQTWQRVDGFPAMSLTFVLFDPHGVLSEKPTPVIYAGAADRTKPALYRSADAGVTWSSVSDQPSGYMIQHAACDGQGVLYLTFSNNPGPNDTTDGAVWKYEFSGNRWTNISPITPSASHHDSFSYAGLGVDARHAGVVMVSTLDRWTKGDEIFRSTDGGARWKPILANSTWDNSAAPYSKAFKPHWIGSVALDPFDSDRALFATGYGVFTAARATAVDHGATTPWLFADDGLEETVVAELVSPPAGAPLLSALFDLGGFRHDDLTTSPAAGTLQPSRGTSTSMAFAAQRPMKLVRTHSGAARGALSTDGGATWRDFAATPPPATAHGAGRISVSCDGRRLVWLPKGSGPYFSTDDGATWTAGSADFLSPTDYHNVGPVADGANPDKFYVYDVATGRVHLSIDGGAHFSATAALPAGGGSPQTEAGREGRLWVPTPGGLFVSNDSGRNFQPIDAVQAADQIGFGRAAPGADLPAVFLAGRIAGRQGIFRSDDGGRSWIAINDSARQFGWINALTGDPRVFGRVYLGTGGRGIFYGEPAKP
jgi:photosystem II stability/assembly factor-like uncharacterized protein